MAVTSSPVRQGIPTWLWWTGGKDAAWALTVMRDDPACEVLGLVAAVNSFDGRTAGHGIRRELVEEQAAAADLPLRVLECASRGAPFSVCDADIRSTFHDLSRQGVEAVAFGDLVPNTGTRPPALLANTGLKPAFPLAGRHPRRHAQSMLASGLSARVCAVEKASLPATLAGRRFDESFLADLPIHVDPCGENNEFHTFAEWAPGWRFRVPVAPRESLECRGFAFADLLAVDPDAAPRIADANLAALTGAIDEDFRLVDLAPIAALAPSIFKRHFRRRMGMSFRDWVVLSRVECACQMLNESDIAVDTLARALGFRSRRAFRRAFRARTGLSPSAYRKKAVAGEPLAAFRKPLPIRDDD